LWLGYFSAQGIDSLLLHRDDETALRQILKRVTARLETRNTRANRIMIVGIPNVGKSTLINLLADRKIAKVGDEPAVTKARQEIKLGENLVLLDTPGILWPKLEDQQAAYRLAATGAIRNTAIELGDVGLFAVEFLQQRYADHLQERYGLDPAGMQAVALLEAIGKKRGCLTKGGIDFTKAGELVVNDLRSGKLGLLSLETPGDIPITANEPSAVNAS
jgi:ribosome biogenesis GTPase A